MDMCAGHETGVAFPDAEPLEKSHGLISGSAHSRERIRSVVGLRLFGIYSRDVTGLGDTK